MFVLLKYCSAAVMFTNWHVLDESVKVGNQQPLPDNTNFMMICKENSDQICDVQGRAILVHLKLG